MLGEALEKKKCNSYYSSADADLLIVQKAVESSRKTDTVLVGDDTDLLVLLQTLTAFFSGPNQRKIQRILEFGIYRPSNSN